MKAKLFINIKELFQVLDQSEVLVRGKRMNRLPSIKNAYLYIENQKIVSFGEMSILPENYKLAEIINVEGKFVLPTFCDSHTHLIFYKYREKEFEQRINGLTYQEIAKKGGGILNSAKKLSLASSEELLELSIDRLNQAIKTGTGAIEIKSGYGLSLEGELKILRVANELKKHTKATIKTTFLGAHALPEKYKDSRKNYLDLIMKEMIPIIAQENLADFIDVFCETNYFSPLEMGQILTVGKQYGLIPKVHVNQFTSIGGLQTAVNNQALTVDHLEVMKPQDFEILESSETLPCLLPGCSFFLNIPYAPAKKLIDKGLAIVLASDYNPGSTPSSNMIFINSLACIKQKLTPEQAINATTINGAYAMGLSSDHGSITKQKFANFIVTSKLPSLAYLPYSFGHTESLIESVYLKGEQQVF